MYPCHTAFFASAGWTDRRKLVLLIQYLKQFLPLLILLASHLHDEGCLGGRTAVVAPAVHEHGLQVLVVCDAGDHLEQGPRVLL